MFENFVYLVNELFRWNFITLENIKKCLYKEKPIPLNASNYEGFFI